MRQFSRRASRRAADTRRRRALRLVSVAVLLLGGATAALASLDKPDSVFYGSAELGGQPAPVGTVVSAWIDDVQLDRHVIGDGTESGHYLLRIPVAQTTTADEPRNGFAFEGETVAVFLDDRFSAALQVVGGTIEERDLTEGPLEIPGLVLWLDAAQIEGLSSDDPVALWPDRSGQGHDATQATASAQPRYVRTGMGNHPAVRFDGNDFLNNTTFNGVSGATQASAFVVRKADTTGSTLVAFCSFDSGVRGEVHFDEAWAFAGRSRLGTAPFSSTAWHLWGSTFNGALSGNANRLKQRIDGTQTTLSFPLLSISTALPVGNGYDVGRQLNTANTNWLGDIAEVIVYSRALDETERRRIETYVARKYAIAAIPVLNQPPPTPTPTGPLDAAFVSQSVPTSMTAGQPVNVTVTMRNIGSNTWIPGQYALGPQSPHDNNNWGSSRISFANSVTTGQEAVFSWTVTAPSIAGTYNFQWRMLNIGVAWFGELSQLVPVLVNAPGVGETPVPTPTPTQVAQLGAPVALNPAGTMTAGSTLLTWTAVEGAFAYGFDVLDETMGTALYAGQTPATSAQIPGALDPSHDYRWRVRAVDSRGWSEWSDWLSFGVAVDASNGSVPRPLTPAGITGDMTPTFLWQPVTGALEYALTVHDANLASDVVASVSAAPTGQTIEALSPAHSYRWRVRARTSAGWGDESPWQTFAIARCLGDCDTDGAISIGELIRSVNVALRVAPVEQCGAGDSNSNSGIEISELITAVRYALNGCP